MIDAIILARKNSKRLKNKIHLKIRGKRVINYTFESVIKSKEIKKCFCFSDDKKIKKYINNKKIDFSINRPKKISGDKTKSETTLLYLIKKLKKKNKIGKHFILLQPTSPLRTAKIIDKCIKIYIKQKYDSFFSLREATKKEILNLKKKKFFIFKNKHLVSDGAIYITNTNKFLKTKKLYSKKFGYIKLPKKNTVDIDTIEDLMKAKRFMKRNFHNS